MIEAQKNLHAIPKFLIDNIFDALTKVHDSFIQSTKFEDQQISQKAHLSKTVLVESSKANSRYYAFARHNSNNVFFRCCLEMPHSEVKPKTHKEDVVIKMHFKSHLTHS